MNLGQMAKTQFSVDYSNYQNVGKSQKSQKFRLSQHSKKKIILSNKQKVMTQDLNIIENNTKSIAQNNRLVSSCKNNHANQREKNRLQTNNSRVILSYSNNKQTQKIKANHQNDYIYEYDISSNTNSPLNTQNISKQNNKQQQIRNKLSKSISSSGLNFSNINPVTNKLKDQQLRQQNKETDFTSDECEKSQNLYETSLMNQLYKIEKSVNGNVNSNFKVISKQKPIILSNISKSLNSKLPYISSPKNYKIFDIKAPIVQQTIQELQYEQDEPQYNLFSIIDYQIDILLNNPQYDQCSCQANQIIASKPMHNFQWKTGGTLKKSQSKLSIKCAKLQNSHSKFL